MPSGPGAYWTTSPTSAAGFGGFAPVAVEPEGKPGTGGGALWYGAIGRRADATTPAGVGWAFSCAAVRTAIERSAGCADDPGRPCPGPAAASAANPRGRSAASASRDCQRCGPPVVAGGASPAAAPASAGE